MEIWLDTIDFDLIKKAKNMGILYGITTNPSIVSKSNFPLEELLKKLLVEQNGPVTVQVTSDQASQMIHQGEALFSFSNRILIKVPVTGEGLHAIHAFSLKGIPTMATAVFDQNQILLATKAGASYIAPYFSRICENDIEGIETVKAMMRMLTRYNFSSKIIAASLRTAEQIKECAEIGIHAVTLNEKVFESFLEDHPMTKQALQRFSRDWEEAPARKSLPL